jgi:flagella basal body P-ring formation protein FlgA
MQAVPDISEQRLVELLARQALSEARSSEGTWLERYWPEILLVNLVSLLVVLAVVTYRVFSAENSSIRALAASHVLEPGRPLTTGDLGPSDLPAATGRFTDTSSLVGLTLARQLSAGDLISINDVFQPHVEARTDIVSGTIILPNMVTTTIGTYVPGAAVQLDGVLGHASLSTIVSGSVVLRDVVDPSPSRVDEVLVVAPDTLPAFHVIAPGDVRETSGPYDSGAPLKISDVLSHYLLKPASPGTTLKPEQLSAVTLAEADLTGRQILTLPVKPERLSQGLHEGEHLSLLFMPSADKLVSGPNRVDDVLLLAISRESGAAFVVVGLTTDQLKTITSLLLGSEVFIVEQTR